MTASPEVRVATHSVLLATTPAESSHPRLVDGLVAYWPTDTLPRGARAAALLEPDGTITVLDASVVLTEAALAAARELLETRCVTRIGLREALLAWAATRVSSDEHEATPVSPAVVTVLRAPQSEIEYLLADDVTRELLPGVTAWPVSGDVEVRAALLHHMDAVERAVLVRLHREAFVEAAYRVRAEDPSAR